MPQKKSPFVGLNYGWDFGEAGWNVGMDQNLLFLSFLINPVVDSITTTLPTLINGQAHYLSSDNSFYLAADGVWEIIPCPLHFVFKVRSTGEYYQRTLTGSERINNFSEISAEQNEQRLVLDGLGSAAFVDASDFITGSELDVLESQMSQQIDSVRDDLSSTQVGFGADLIGYSPSVSYNSGTVGEQLTLRPSLRPDRFLPPSGLGWNPPIAVYSDTNGKIATDFDVAAYRTIGNGKHCWVDPVNGNNSNGGSTEATAKKSLSVAISDPTITTIYIVAGALFDRDSVAGVLNGWGPALTTDKNIICPNGRAKLTMRHPTGVWTNQGSGVYSTTRSNTTAVWDTTRYDQFGDYTKVPLVASLAELSASAEGWFLTGSTLYVKRLDGTSPTITTTAIFLTSDPLRPGYVSGNAKVYLENLDFEGGDAAFDATTVNSSDRLEIYAKNCSFKYSVTLNGLNIQGASKVYLQNCVASNNKRDGFNYHFLSGISGPGVAIEVDCTGRRNGISDTNNNNNGSTAHDGWKIVRVNGNYYNNKGPQVVDVDQAKSWNIGVTGAYSVADGFSAASSFRTTTEGEMWFDRSYAHSSTLSAVAESNGKLYVRNTVLDGDTYTIDGGTLSSY